jgi:hypothetical protein
MPFAGLRGTNNACVELDPGIVLSFVVQEWGWVTDHANPKLRKLHLWLLINYYLQEYVQIGGPTIMTSPMQFGVSERLVANPFYVVPIIPRSRFVKNDLIM